MSLGDVFKDSWNKFSSNFNAILAFIAIYYFIPVILAFLLLVILTVSLGSFDLFLQIMQGNEDAFNFESSIKPFFGFIIGIIIFFIVFIVVNIFTYSAFYGLDLKSKNYSYQDLAKSGKRSFWKFIGRSIILGIFLMFLFILLIIPGIIFSIYWIFAPLIWFSEPSKSFDYSLKRSKELVKGRWWRTFGFVILISLITSSVGFILQSLPVVGLLARAFAGIFGIYFYRSMYLDYASNRK